jgi:F-type H+-transporting ATPase subunit epsilon
MEVCIVKPDRIFFKEDAEELLLPTSTGYIGILQEHAPLVTGLDNGVLALRQGTSWKILALLGGFGVIKENRVNILCRDIEDAAEIDVDEAERRVAEARTGMEKLNLVKSILKTNLRLTANAHVLRHTQCGKTQQVVHLYLVDNLEIKI